MKSLTSILFMSLFFFLLWPVNSEAQVLRRTLGKLGERVVEKKIEKEVDKKIDEVADSIVYALDGEKPMTEEERQEAQKNRQRAGELMRGMMGGINQVDLPESYAFEISIEMELEDHKKNISQLTYFISENSPVIGYRMTTDDKKNSQEQFVVMDMEEKYMATFIDSDGQKVAMSMPLPVDMIASMAAEEAEKQEEKDFTFEKTGNTKTINGYHCTEFVITTGDHIQHMWMTKDVDVKLTFTEVFSQMMNSKQKIQNPMEGEGYPMLIEIIEKKNNRKTYMRTKEIKEGSFPFVAAEYSYAY